MATQIYVVISRRERGYWNNKTGWVYDLASATRFDTDDSDFNSALAADAQTITIAEAIRIGDFDLN